MTKTSTKNRKLVATKAAKVTKKTHLTMKKFAVAEDHVVALPFNGGCKWVKSDCWYVAYPSSEGPVGYQRFHCLVRDGVPLFATEKNYMRPRMYKLLDELLNDPTCDAFERR